jgi:hypothetical protein
MQAIEAVNRQRVQATWQANLAMEQWTRQYAANTQTFAQDWVNNHDGVRDQFSSAMSELTNFWTTSTMPALMQAGSSDYATAVSALKPIMAAQREQAGAFSQALTLGISGLTNLMGSWATVAADKKGGWVGTLFGSPPKTDPGFAGSGSDPGYGKRGTTVVGLPWLNK